MSNKCNTLLASAFCLLSLAPPPAAAQDRNASQLSNVKTVWVILMENHNWTGNNSGARFGAPDLKGSPLAPYINGPLLENSAHAEQYYNPPGNHPSQPNYIWLEAGTNFGVLADTQPGDPQLNTHRHLVSLLEKAGISWRAYAEPDFGSADFDVCPLDFSYLDVEHLPFVYFKDVNKGLNPKSKECREHVKPYSQLSTDLANQTSARYNFIVPNLCHDGHEKIRSCDRDEDRDNTKRSDAWLARNVPLITESQEYKDGGAIFVVWDEAEDTSPYDDGPIGMFLLSPFAKGGGKSAYSNSIHYDHSSLLKTLQEIYNVGPFLRGAGEPSTQDLSDLFRSK